MSTFRVFRTSYNRSKDAAGDWVDNNKNIDHEVESDFFELEKGDLDVALVFYTYDDAGTAKPVAAFKNWEYVLLSPPSRAPLKGPR